MKKILFLSTLIAAVLLASSCQKEQELVTLGAVISQPGKTYIDDRYPCWNNGDQVYVNNATYPISAASGSSAQIADVVGADSYRAIFPASLVPANMDITNSNSIPVTLPATQLYTLVDGHQRVNAPMGAYSEGSTLQFHNLCSVVRVTVSNQLSTDLALSGIIIEAEHAFLSGQGTATVSGQSTDHITMSNTASHSVRLNFSGTATATVNAHGNKPFDIVVPAFTTDNVTITLITADGKYCELPLTGSGNGVALANNTVTTVTVNVTELSLIPAAELVDGWTFNDAVPDNATAIVFEYNSTVTTGIVLSTTDSPVPIYGNLDGTIWRVTTSSSIINANLDCSYMFLGSGYMGKSFASLNLDAIEFGSGFNTSNVINMYNMFAGCRCSSIDLSSFITSNVESMVAMFAGCSCSSLDLSNFNTSNVISMKEMFSYCGSLTSLDLSTFNTENVTDMSYMFWECSSLAHLNLSNSNTSNVIYMFGMFDECSSLINLNLSNFDMSNVIDKGGMCSNLSITSGYCSIICPLFVENAIKEVDPDYNPSNPTWPHEYYYYTWLPTSGVNFTWVRPSGSK